MTAQNLDMRFGKIERGGEKSDKLLIYTPFFRDSSNPNAQRISLPSDDLILGGIRRYFYTEQKHRLTIEDGADVLAVLAAARTAKGISQKDIVRLVLVERIGHAIELLARLLNVPIAEFELV